MGTSGKKKIMSENNVFISGDLWKQYLKKKKKVFSCVETSENTVFAAETSTTFVETSKKFFFHVFHGKKMFVMHWDE